MMWFDQDWSLAKCHRVIISNYLFILRGDLVEEPVPSYEEVFGLEDPRQPLRHGFDDIFETSLPFIVNVALDQKESNTAPDISRCQRCFRMHECTHCALPVTHNLTLREYLLRDCDLSSLCGNRALF